MRPRHKAAENGFPADDAEPLQRASMRPRHKAAENLPALDALLAERELQ